LHLFPTPPPRPSCCEPLLEYERLVGGGWVMEHDHLIAMLNRLKLTAIRDQLTA